MYQNLRCKVDSLLGSGGEQAWRENKIGTEEKCLHEYNLTLTFEETMGRWVPFTCESTYNLILSFEMEYQHRLCRHNCFARTVMLDRGGAELVCSVLRPDMDVLEYGSGGSTTFFR